MKHKVSELEGERLDRAVVLAAGGTLRRGGSASTDWAVGGPIIEQERLTVMSHQTRGWGSGWMGEGQTHFGPTPLIAAMRAYVARKLGEEVELP